MANKNPSPATRFTSGKKAEMSGRKGGRISAQKKKEYATFQECFKTQMDDEKRKEMFDMLYGRAKRGNLKAFEILRDTLGEKPVEKVENDVYEDDGFMKALALTSENLFADGDDSDMIPQEE